MPGEEAGGPGVGEQRARAPGTRVDGREHLRGHGAGVVVDEPHEQPRAVGLVGVVRLLDVVEEVGLVAGHVEEPRLRAGLLDVHVVLVGVGVGAADVALDEEVRLGLRGEVDGPRLADGAPGAGFVKRAGAVAKLHLHPEAVEVLTPEKLDRLDPDDAFDRLVEFR